MKNKCKNEKGITLIALIVTIIVLIILAGISVNLLLGENGLLQRAKDAKVVQEKAEVKERVALAIANKQIQTKGELTQADLEEVLGAYGTVDKNNDGTIIGLIPEGKNYEIPVAELYNGTLSGTTGGGPVVTLAGGLYDENDTLIISWEELTAEPYNFRIDLDYWDLQSNPTFSLPEGNALMVVLEENQDLTGATKLVIPSSITRIGNAACAMASITSVEIPSSVTYIGAAAFAECAGVTSITIPDTVTQIDEEAFYNVPVIIYSGTATGSPWGALHHIDGIVDGDFVYASNAKTEIKRYIGNSENVVIPSTVTIIDESAFSECITYEYGQSQVIGNPPVIVSVSTSVKTVSVPSSVTNIGTDAFEYIPLVIYSGTATGSPWGANERINGVIDGDFAYSNNTETEIIKYIGNGTSITIPSSVTSIAAGVFEDCDNLVSATFTGRNGNYIIETQDGQNNVDYITKLSNAQNNALILKNIGSAFIIKSLNSTYSAGDIVKVINPQNLATSQEFFVIENSNSNNNTVKLISKEKVNINNFSQEGQWYSDFKLDFDISTNVYANSSIKTVVNNYAASLNVQITNQRLLSYSEAQQMSNFENREGHGNFWLGTAVENTQDKVYCVRYRLFEDMPGPEVVKFDIVEYYCNPSIQEIPGDDSDIFCLRPVIEISK